MKNAKKTPKSKKKKFTCETCSFSCSKKSDFKRHISTYKHLKANDANKHANKKTPEYFSCETCCQLFQHSSSLSRHKKTCKNNPSVLSKIIQNYPKIIHSKNDSSQRFECECGKTYKFQSGLCKHKKKCFITTSNEVVEVDHEKESLKQEVVELRNMMKNIIQIQNQQTQNFTDAIKQVIPKIGNTYNNKMSINIYLNEKCKDAMNLTDFVENVKVSIEDLLYTKNHGFIKGISNIFVKQLQDMEPTQRPIHCSDKKRLQFYVKDDNKWEKDNVHKKIDKTIDEISFKQIKLLKQWENKHPNYLEDDELLKEWQLMIKNMTGGSKSEAISSKEKSFIKRELGTTVDVQNELIEKK